MNSPKLTCMPNPIAASLPSRCQQPSMSISARPFVQRSGPSVAFPAFFCASACGDNPDLKRQVTPSPNMKRRLHCTKARGGMFALRSICEPSFGTETGANAMRLSAAARLKTLESCGTAGHPCCSRTMQAWAISPACACGVAPSTEISNADHDAAKNLLKGALSTPLRSEAPDAPSLCFMKGVSSNMTLKSIL